MRREPSRRKYIRGEKGIKREERFDPI
jgi:hypothetical protein